MDLKVRALVVACFLVLSTVVSLPVAVAQDSAGNNGRTPVFGDPNVHIESWSYSGDTFTVTFHSNRTTLVSLTAPPEGSKRGASEGFATRKTLHRGSTTVTIYSPTGSVWISTSTSLQNGRYTELDAQTGSSIVPEGPYSGSDARDVGLGSAFGVAVAHLWVAVRAKLGSSDKAERVA